MIFILETELNKNKYALHSFILIYGLNNNKSLFLCKSIGLSKNFKIARLKSSLIKKLVKIIKRKKIKINNDLKKTITFVYKNSLEIKLYKAIRKVNGFPARGQRTHTNAVTAKKNKKKKK